MAASDVRQDLDYLAGVLEHRGSNTENERIAAEYLRRRLEACCPDVEIDGFQAPDTYISILALYYGEFLFVMLLAMWWPIIAFAYGTLVFMAYFAELSGYRVVGRLLPQTLSQNVVARLLAVRPHRLFIVTAHYDSPLRGPSHHFLSSRHFRHFHLGLVCCMAVVLISCVIQAAGLYADHVYRLDLVAGWSATLLLTSTALWMGYGEWRAGYADGAQEGAGSAATLLELARRFAERPLINADLWLVATGSKEGGLNGIRHFLDEHDLDRHETFFLNLDEISGETLAYVTREGLLHRFQSSRMMLEIAAAHASRFDAVPIEQGGLPGDALVPLARGYDTLTLTRAMPSSESSPSNVAVVEKTAAFAEDILRGLEQRSVKTLSPGAS